MGLFTFVHRVIRIFVAAPFALVNVFNSTCVM